MRLLKLSFTIVAGLYIAALLALYVGQRRLVYFNTFNPANAASPASAGFDEAAILRLTTADDERLVAWYVAPTRGKLLALYFHGNGGSLSSRVYALRALSADGMGVLAIDYRGFGGSTGSPSEAGLHLDGDAAYAKARELGYAPSEILLVGESLGTVELPRRRLDLAQVQVVE